MITIVLLFLSRLLYTCAARYQAVVIPPEIPIIPIFVRHDC